MKRPSFQFYPGDWQANQKLRRCSPAARGAWIDILCILHDCDDYGIARYSLKELARAAGADLKHVRELVEKGVLKGSETDPVRFEWAPTHAGKKGQPVVLVDSSVGPCWYCSRFVVDEYKRNVRGKETRFDSENNQPNRAPKASPNRRDGDGKGYGPSSSSSSSITPESLKHAELPPPAHTHERAREEPAGGGDAGVATAAGLACRAMRQAGVTHTNSSDPRLLAALADGVTREALADTVREGLARSPPIEGARLFPWAIKTAHGRLQDLAAVAANSTPSQSLRHDRIGPVSAVVANLHARHGTTQFDLSRFSDDDDAPAVPA